MPVIGPATIWPFGEAARAAIYVIGTCVLGTRDGFSRPRSADTPQFPAAHKNARQRLFWDA